MADRGKSLQAIRGMHDIVPGATLAWQAVETCLRQIVSQYGYQEIRFPIVEQSALFERSVGKATDIVEKEMYTFTDQGEVSLTLRPEGTAGCMRAGIEQSLFYGQQQRLWYMGPMFRRERPQRGRCRQFHQFGVEACGFAGPDIDAEVILMSARIWEQLGIKNNLTLQLNCLGSAEDRGRYREALVNYFNEHLAELDQDSQRRLTTNPLRILDSKNPDMVALMNAAPKLPDYLEEKSKAHFAGLCQLLDQAGCQYELNPRLVRGLDYYCLTVFEWVTTEQGAQNSVCAGGRYDGLVEQLGGQPTPAAGFALGLERILIEIEKNKSQPQAPACDAYMILNGDAAVAQGLDLAEKLRTALPTLKLQVNCGEGNFKKQFKRADKSGAHWALILAEEELKQNLITVKDLRGGHEQQQFKFDELLAFFQTKTQS